MAGERKVCVDLDKLEKALIVYDTATDTLYVNISDEEADEVIMLENGVVVRLRGSDIVGLSIHNVSEKT